ncbi:hypothetical protein CEXT_230691 [Caerostris extrusa]|uniref:Uncharacterized protein n=1 Tax=Caerostris extrusa TaxID=172846 RepID=A0AAV4XN92_CAEEX|nr:hypothetical protein CEXT_230691 [Caerostris extrusa]
MISSLYEDPSFTIFALGKRATKASCAHRASLLVGVFNVRSHQAVVLVPQLCPILFFSRNFLRAQTTVRPSLSFVE